ncbi:hypothetical protein QA601_11015 [Chitinispirillales bacterium ANBcel5]|uniref:hypothetical protein n=1 Tax=Cellulosispirillum alkaliphilum TaxID=3039283 RepID=UPI002A57EFC1|nr:hypothetical protein [Chitinispirillales bacterium ANBcel5]
MVIYTFSFYKIVITAPKLHSSKIKLCCASIFFLLGTFSIPYAQHSFYIPINETEGDELLERGAIDSLSWAQMRPLYSLPLSVPLGELKRLTDIFPQLKEEIPSEQDLIDYHPWTNREIQMFFSDYPTLDIFRPLISFRDFNEEFKGNLALNFTKPFKDGIATQTLRFNYSAVEWIKSKGRVTIEETNAKWLNRSINFSFPWLEVQVGNFRPNFPQKLFYGFFPTIRLNDSTYTHTWLVPKSSRWNGFLFSSSANNPFRAVSFYHKRDLESATGTALSYSSGTLWNVTAGVSRMEGVFSDIKEKDTYFHLYSTFNIKQWRFELESGSDKHGHTPLFIKATNRLAKQRIDMEYYYFPQGASFPLSRMKRVALFRTSNTSNPQKGATGVTVRINNKLGNRIRFVPQLSLTRSGQLQRHLNSSILLSMLRPVNIRFRYTHISASGQSSTFSHRLFLSLQKSFKRRADLRTTIRANFSDTGEYSYSLLTQSTHNLDDVFEISPLFRATVSKSGNNRFFAGLKQRLNLGNKTWTSFSIEKELNERGWGNVFIRGSSGFLF